MHASIIWLVRLGIDRGLFTLKDALGARLKLGEDVGLLDYAQFFLDSRIVAEDNIELLEQAAGLAQAKGVAGPPADDPFATRGTGTAPAVLRSAPASSPRVRAQSAGSSPTPRLPAATSTPFVAAPSAVATPAAGGLQDFPFARVAVLSDAELDAALRNMLKVCARDGISDLHLSAGARPFVRKQRSIERINDQTLSEADALRLNTILLAPHQRELFLDRKDLDFALALDASNRYRVNLMFHKNGAAGSYRMVAAKVPKLDELGLRNLEAIRKLLSYHNGLILVTGPVGAGKTTTLAALVAELNEKRHDHIITVEDPIEVVQVAVGCNVTQREVGPHTQSFAAALKGALREDPDVIIIGELRDLETIEMAISASETGHLVIGTMHTSDAATTLNRLLDVFPPAQQTQIRASVAESLRGVVCQRLLPATGGGLVLACEILIGNPAVAALIREGKMAGLRNVLETGQRDGMCLMESVVFQLYNEGQITAATARENISNRVLKARIT